MWTVPVLHPAFTFRQPTALGPLEAHVHGFVKRIVHGIPPEPMLLQDPPLAKLQWLLKIAAERHLPIAVDVEAAPPPPPGKREWAVFPQWAQLRAVGVGIDFNSGVGLSWFWPITNKRIYNLLVKALEDENIAKVFCNGWSYDIPLLKRYGIQVR